MSLRALQRRPSIGTFNGLIKHFPNWLKHLAEKKNSVIDSTPWIAFGAIEFLEKIVRSNMEVFEYGSGGSTLFWSTRVKTVVSVEHELLWYTKMSHELLARKIHNVEYIIAGAEDDENYIDKNFKNPAHYLSEDLQFRGKNFENYVKQIDRFPNRTFDMIIIDGRARPSCILHSLNKLKVGGYLIIDNSERDYYLAPFTFAKPDWKVWKFYGPVPYNYHFSETTIIQRT